MIVNLIKATKTAQGLRVEAEIDHTIYPAGQKVRDEQMAQINLTMMSGTTPSHPANNSSSCNTYLFTAP